MNVQGIASPWSCGGAAGGVRGNPLKSGEIWRRMPGLRIYENLNAESDTLRPGRRTLHPLRRRLPGNWRPAFRKAGAACTSPGSGSGVILRRKGRFPLCRCSAGRCSAHFGSIIRKGGREPTDRSGGDRAQGTGNFFPDSYGPRAVRFRIHGVSPGRGGTRIGKTACRDALLLSDRPPPRGGQQLARAACQSPSAVTRAPGSLEGRRAIQRSGRLK